MELAPSRAGAGVSVRNGVVTCQSRKRARDGAGEGINDGGKGRRSAELEEGVETPGPSMEPGR